MAKRKSVDKETEQDNGSEVNAAASTEYGLIRKIDIDGEMQSAYLSYAMSVIVSRALPDARDGLKPVQRRILYAMHDMGLRADIALQEIGAYRRRGAGQVSPARRRRGLRSHGRAWRRTFRMRYLLVDGQGNFGSVDGDAPAAMRYTEARLAPIADETAGRHREGHGRLHRQLRRHPDRAERAARGRCPTCSSTARRASRWAWRPTSRRTTWARSATRCAYLIDHLDRAGRRDRRRPDAVSSKGPIFRPAA